MLNLFGAENPFGRDVSKMAEDLDVAGAPQSRFGVVNTQHADSVVVPINQRYAEIGDQGAVEHRRVVLENRVDSHG